jgi:hypothetical protein
MIAVLFDIVKAASNDAARMCRGSIELERNAEPLCTPEAGKVVDRQRFMRSSPLRKRPDRTSCNPDPTQTEKDHPQILQDTARNPQKFCKAPRENR